MLKIGLPKGNMLDISFKVINKILGTEFDKTNRNLYYNNEEIEIYLLKHRDIPKLVNEGIIDLGITSEEWIEEKQLMSEVEIIKYLKWCDTRVSLINKVGQNIDKNSVVKCITEFPNIAMNYFNSRNIKFNVCNVSGSSEALVGTIFDCCIDCVETGKTLEENNLYEEEVIFYSKMVLISKKDKKVLNNNSKFIKIIDEIRKG